MLVDQFIFFKNLEVPKLYKEILFGINGVIIWNKGGIYYVDFGVTGSNDGTSKDIKFQLKIFFEKHPFPVIEKLEFDSGTF